MSIEFLMSTGFFVILSDIRIFLCAICHGLINILVMYCSTLVEQILLRMAKAKQESPPLRIYAIGPTQKHKKTLENNSKFECLSNSN